MTSTSVVEDQVVELDSCLHKVEKTPLKINGWNPKTGSGDFRFHANFLETNSSPWKIGG